MKKLTLSAIAAVVAMTLASCGMSTPKAKLKSDVDTLSYAIGMAQSNGLTDYLVRGIGVDTTYMDDFFKGVLDGANAGDDKKKAAYMAGVQIGQQISNQMVKGINHELFGNDSTRSISLRNFLAGFISGTTGKKALMTMDQAGMIVEMKMEAIKAKAMQEQYGPNREAGEKYLAEYAKKEGVKKLEGGVLYRVLKEGSGELPTDTSMVMVHYEGKTIDGKVFDSSYERKEPTEFMVNRVIPGWITALKNMPEGSIWEVVIPQDQAYGARDMGAIKPFSALIFRVELIKINK